MGIGRPERGRAPGHRCLLQVVVLGGLHVVNADGAGRRQVTTGTAFRGFPTCSPDRRLAFQCEVETGNFDICSMIPTAQDSSA